MSSSAREREAWMPAEKLSSSRSCCALELVLLRTTTSEARGRELAGAIRHAPTRWAHCIAAAVEEEGERRERCDFAGARVSGGCDALLPLRKVRPCSKKGNSTGNCG
jgi:hypothetical protein